MKVEEKRAYAKESEFVDECVQVFLKAADSALWQARGEAFGNDGIDGEEAAQRARFIWAAMQRARLFCVEPARWIRAYRASDMYVEEKLCGLTWEPPNAKRVFDAEEEARAKKLYEAYEQYGTHWPFPNQLPFDSVFLTYGKRFCISQSPTAFLSRMRMDAWEQLGSPPVYLVGQLLAWQGDQTCAFTAVMFDSPPLTQRYLKNDLSLVKAGEIGWIATYLDEEWHQPASLDPWILNMLVSGINEHKSIIEEYRPSLGQRLDRKKASKQAKQMLPLPAPFYMCRLRDELIQPPAKKPAKVPGRPTEWSHRWDVRGHECVRVERGDLPIDEKLRAKLKKRGYRIYEGMSLAGDDASRLLKRGVRAPSPREWMAVLSYWRESMIKGPADKPYIPAARVGV